VKAAADDGNVDVRMPPVKGGRAVSADVRMNYFIIDSESLIIPVNIFDEIIMLILESKINQSYHARSGSRRHKDQLLWTKKDKCNTLLWVF
jgi:hypothetical protein